jgi:predicted RNase H-like nuclease (RuvC/YqgF family)
MDDLSQRNFRAVQQTINELVVKLQEQYERCERLQQTVSMLSSQMQLMQQTVAVLKATSMGRGPTQ